MNFAVYVANNLHLQFLIHLFLTEAHAGVICFSGCSKCRKCSCSLWTKEKMGNQVHIVLLFICLS